MPPPPPQQSGSLCPFNKVQDRCLYTTDGTMVCVPKEQNPNAPGTGYNYIMTGSIKACPLQGK